MKAICSGLLHVNDWRVVNTDQQQHSRNSLNYTQTHTHTRNLTGYSFIHRSLAAKIYNQRY